MLGLFFYKKKIEEPTKCDLVFKWGSVILLAVMTIVVVAMTFSMSGSDYEFLAVNIQTMCENNHTWKPMIKKYLIKWKIKGYYNY